MSQYESESERVEMADGMIAMLRASLSAERSNMQRLQDRIAALEAENDSARAILHEIGAYGNALARHWLEAHPKGEGK